MNFPAAPNGGIVASLGQAAGCQAEIMIAPRGGQLNLYPPQEDLSAEGGLKPGFISDTLSFHRRPNIPSQNENSDWQCSG